jgi:16S rRNA (guanine527-N7)-methyltransferase
VEQERALRDFLVTSATGLGISLTDQQARQFLLYLSQLLEWNRTTNLTSITNPYEVISKHFIDSLAALNALKFPLEGVVIDVGTGAGFPGIPLKIARGDLRLLLVESSLKKCSFLRSIVGTLRLEAVSIFAGALDRYAVQEPSAHADVVVVRALRTEVVAGSAALILKPNGHLLLYRTERSVDPPSGAFRIDSHYDYALPNQHGRRVVSVLARSG